MAVTPETLRLLRDIRILLDATVDDATRDLVKAWARAWDSLVADWDAAAAELIALARDGKWPTRQQVVRLERAMKALDLSRNLLEDLADNAGVRIMQDLPDVVAAAERHIDVIRSQYPATARLTVLFDEPSAEQIAAIVRRTTERITSDLRPLSDRAAASMYSHLVRGVALGDNPKTTAAKLVRSLEGDFNGGLTRALVVCRTEMLDAHREAAAAQHQANSETLRGWAWEATLDTRTCPSCWAKHGTEYPLSEAGPHDHQQGRCARLPVTKTWADLGFDIDEPASVMPDAEDVFRGLSRADQLTIMGAKRLALLDSGQATWTDLTSLRTTSGWRNSWAPTAVRDLAS